MNVVDPKTKEKGFPSIPLLSKKFRQSVCLIKNSTSEVLNWKHLGIDLYVVKSSQSQKTNETYITSFVTQYVKYVAEEVLSSNAQKSTTKKIIKTIKPFALALTKKLRLNNIIWVNNTLVSTPLYSDSWNQIEPSTLCNQLSQYYPNNSIILRGVIEKTNPTLFQRLKDENFIHILGRQVYIFDPMDLAYQKKRPFQMDKKFAEKQDSFYWTSLDLENENEVERALELYTQLYINKHSKFNPEYTTDFVRYGFNGYKLKFEVLKKYSDQKIYAVQGVHETEHVLNTPFIGYDLNAPKKDGLYRLMNYRLMEASISSKKMLNMSSGAGDFKSQRGGKPTFEYQMIYPDNLSFAKKIIWKTISKALENNVKKTMQTLKV